jgi:chromate reductase, NAD(P)H dehydrogenase (quinone)
MKTDIRFVGISGSLRKRSYNTALLNAAQELLPKNVVMEHAKISDIPLFNSDIEDSERLQEVIYFRETLMRADAIVIASPEYNYSIPGVLKNAIDWASRGKDSPLVGKPVALMGATMGMWGTVRMQQAFRPVFQFLNMVPINKPEVLVAQAQNKFDVDGKLVDEETQSIIRQQLIALKQLVLQVRTQLD